uniref:Protein kinase domain-containing protein n=1 Tax=Steinernema glaseri TaxID=37863 RepID=A0A1I7Y5Z3_9BILA
MSQNLDSSRKPRSAHDKPAKKRTSREKESSNLESSLRDENPKEVGEENPRRKALKDKKKGEDAEKRDLSKYDKYDSPSKTKKKKGNDEERKSKKMKDGRGRHQKKDGNHKKNEKGFQLDKNERLLPGMQIVVQFFQVSVLGQLGSGGFGDVYLVKDIAGNKYALKTEYNMKGLSSRMPKEVKAYDKIMKCRRKKKDETKHLVSMYGSGSIGDMKFFVMTPVGESVEQLIVQYEVGWPTILRLVTQMFDSIVELHKVGYVHRDIKPGNFSVGLPPNHRCIYLLDLGLTADNVDDINTLPKLSRYEFIGTLMYASRTCHQQKPQTARDDLESWLYTVLDIFSPNDVPWATEKDRIKVYDIKEKFFEDPNKYINGPSQFVDIANVIKDLAPCELPNYSKIRNLLEDAGKDINVNVDDNTIPFDWKMMKHILKEQQRVPMKPNQLFVESLDGTDKGRCIGHSKKTDQCEKVGDRHWSKRYWERGDVDTNKEWKSRPDCSIQTAWIERSVHISPERARGLLRGHCIATVANPCEGERLLLRWVECCAIVPKHGVYFYCPGQGTKMPPKNADDGEQQDMPRVPEQQQRADQNSPPPSAELLAEADRQRVTPELLTYMAEFNFPYMANIDKYERIAKIGQGSFGEVFKARCRKTSQLVAMKKILMESEKEGVLKHENILEFIEVCREKKAEEEHRYAFYLIFTFCDHDLAGLLHNKVDISLEYKKTMLKHLFTGLSVLHGKNIMHRDMKPVNILLGSDGYLKLGDLGMARPLLEKTPELPDACYTNSVVTLWYRPPELLLGEVKYGPEIDMWSAGCIMAQFWTIKPIMQGDTEQEQLYKITFLCGSITPTAWPDREKLPGWGERPKMNENLSRKLHDELAKSVSDEQGLDLIEKLLVLDPKNRLDANKALTHPFFYTKPLPNDNVKELLDKLPENMFTMTNLPKCSDVSQAQQQEEQSQPEAQSEGQSQRPVL